MIRNGSQRHWLVHLLAMALALSLVTGFAVTAGLRVHRKEQDGMNDWRVEPLSIAHRGDDSAPENSLHAIANAGAAGADFAEIDVRLTSDGTPVVFHDRKTGRLCVMRSVMTHRCMPVWVAFSGPASAVYVSSGRLER